MGKVHQDSKGNREPTCVVDEELYEVTQLPIGGMKLTITSCKMDLSGYENLLRDI